MRAPIFFAIAIFLNLLFGASPARQAWAAKPINVGVFSLAPIVILNENAPPQGIYPALLDRIAKDENWTITYVSGTWAQCLERLKNGSIDLITCIAYSKDRTSWISYSRESVVDVWGQVFCRPDASVQTIKDLHKKKIGIMKNGINGANYKAMAEGFGIENTFVIYPSHDDIYNAIHNGDIFAGVAPNHHGIRRAQAYGIVPTSIQFSPFPIFFGTLKHRHTDILDTIDGHISRWKSDPDSPYYREIKHWFSNLHDEVELPRWLVAGFSMVAAIALCLFAFNRVLKIQVIKKTQALKESQALYKNLVENANTAILRWDTRGNLLYINPFGLQLVLPDSPQPEEAAGALPKIPPNPDIALLEEMVNRFKEAPDQYTQHETCHEREGQGAIFMQWNNKAIQTPDGTLKEIFSTGTDISQRKHLEQHLLNAQKMEAIGTLAGGIAHDFNNILTVISGNAELASANAAENRDISPNLDRILNAAHRAQELTGQILAFSRESDLEKVPLNLSEITSEILNMIRSTLPATIEIVSDISCSQMILANPTQVHQVILNLCTNAFHAMEKEGGRLSIRIRPDLFDQDTLFPDGMIIRAGRFLVLEIKDTGAGILPEVLPKIFEPYFTTKKPGKGTGMGLAMVHGIILDHDGYIRVTSRPNQGTQFDIYLPVAEGMNIPDRKKTEEIIEKGTETIMIVDDEKPITELLCKIINREGYKTEGFTSSPEALSAFSREPDRYDLIITDMTMPDLTGWQLSEKIAQIRDDIPFIICSGYNEPEANEKAGPIGATRFLNKPVLKKDLLKTIRTVLDTPR